MKRLSCCILVVTLALAASCFGGKRGSRGGTNLGSGSDTADGPWNQGGGGVPAAYTKP